MQTVQLSQVSYFIDDARSVHELPIEGQKLTVVGYEVGFEYLLVGVFSYLPSCKVSEDEAEDIATDYLLEIGYFEDVDSIPNIKFFKLEK